jgi:hypothetical protein
MRVTLVTLALVALTACHTGRSVATRPQPQKSALRLCTFRDQSCPAPMLIVDGKTVDFESADLESLPIEQVDVVKGPSAIQLYGDAARNGAVIITSKKVRPQ